VVGVDEIKEANEVILNNGNYIETPLLMHANKLSASLKTLSCTDIHIKLDNMQVAGCFKTRGIVNQLHHVKDRSKGIISMSGGNYARALSILCAEQGLKPTLVMPDNVPKDKIAFVKEMGANVELCSRTEIQQKVDELVALHGYLYLHPFDDLRLIAGYGSCALEIIKQVPDVDLVVVGVGGGGWISGIAATLKQMSWEGKKDVKVVGVEPEGANAMYLSLQQNKVVHLSAINTICSGLAPPFVGTNTLLHCQKFVDEVVLVKDEEVTHAMKMLYHDCKLVVEPSGAAPIAALLAGKVSGVQGKTVVCVIGGGNVSLQDFVKYCQ